MNPIPDPRFAGGLWCHEVLEGLDAYVAQTLPDEVRASVDAHLQACDQCARFGGAYAHVVRVLQRQLETVSPLDEGKVERLHQRLRNFTQSD